MARQSREARGTARHGEGEPEGTGRQSLELRDWGDGERSGHGDKGTGGDREAEVGRELIFRFRIADFGLKGCGRNLDDKAEV